MTLKKILQSLERQVKTSIVPSVYWGSDVEDVLIELASGEQCVKSLVEAHEAQPIAMKPVLENWRNVHEKYLLKQYNIEQVIDLREDTH